MRFIRRVVRVVFLALTAVTTVMAQTGQNGATAPAAPKPAGLSAAAEDISGTYSFVHEGESLQIILDPSSVSGYVVRRGDLESDRGTMLSQFFRQAAVEGHDVSFITRTIHGVWFEFKGKFERGPGKTRSVDGYYIIKGELKEFTMDQESKSSVRSRQIEFKWIGQPE
jgi:hypothetical protein